MLSSICRFVTARLPWKSSPTPQVLLHPARAGDVLDQRYSIKRRLGAGFGIHSTIWLSKDSVTGNDVILKITGADSTDVGKYSQREAALLQKVGKVQGPTQQHHVTRMLDHFSLDSSFGTHSCLVVEVLGMSVEELIRRTESDTIPIPLCKRITKQVLLGLDFLHRECGIVHIDLKLDNLLLRVEDTKGIPLPGDSESSIDLYRISLGPSAVVICDLGDATETESPFDGVVQPYNMRVPEVYLRIPYGPPADIWNLGCLIFELVTYTFLFGPEATSEWSLEEDMLGQMISIHGLTSFPVDVLARGKFSAKYFDQSGKLLRYTVDPCSIEEMVQSRLTLQPEDEPELFYDMLSRMLRLRPEDRESAGELLSHPWLKDA